MPYVRATRRDNRECSATTYLPWHTISGRPPEDVAREALAEPGVATAEFFDDARSHVTTVEKDADLLETELQVEPRQELQLAPLVELEGPERRHPETARPGCSAQPNRAGSTESDT